MNIKRKREIVNSIARGMAPLMTDEESDHIEIWREYIDGTYNQTCIKFL